MIYRNSKSSELKPSMITQSALMPKKKQKVVTFDREVLPEERHQAMLAGICLVADQLTAKVKSGGKISILNLCNNGGVFTTFIRTYF